MQSEPIIQNGKIQKAGGVIVLDATGEKRIYVVHRPRYDDWTLPKGHIDEGETTQQAAVREVQEETGFTCEVVRELPAHEYQLPSGQRIEVHFFEMQILEEGKPLDAEADRGEWWTIEEASERLTYPSSQAYIRSVFE